MKLLLCLLFVFLPSLLSPSVPTGTATVTWNPAPPQPTKVDAVSGYFTWSYSGTTAPTMQINLYATALYPHGGANVTHTFVNVEDGQGALGTGSFQSSKYTWDWQSLVNGTTTIEYTAQLSVVNADGSTTPISTDTTIAHIVP